MDKRKVILIGMAVLILIFVTGLYFVGTRMSKKKCDIVDFTVPLAEGIQVVPTMNDKISKDTAWCGTFQLVWNDLMNELVGQNVRFEEPLEMVEHLNQQDFNEDCISEEYYYKKFGLKTLDLKAEIERGIREKFNETSDILDNIDWSKEALDQGNEEVKRYLFYTMLKRDFTYKKEFTKLENASFANQYDDVKYFGIDDSTKDEVREQVDVLYYNSEKDCAVLLNTEEGDQVILCKGIQGTTFYEIYENMMNKANSYDGQKYFEENDCLKVPEISFNIKREYTELENKKFYNIQNDELEIMKAIQSIKMKMDEKGGSIKSEAVLDVEMATAIFQPEEKQPRYFYFDDEYVVFLVQEGKEKPYFATCISDITKFQ